LDPIVELDDVVTELVLADLEICSKKKKKVRLQLNFFRKGYLQKSNKYGIPFSNN